MSILISAPIIFHATMAIINLDTRTPARRDDMHLSRKFSPKELSKEMRRGDADLEFLQSLHTTRVSQTYK